MNKKRSPPASPPTPQSERARDEGIDFAALMELDGVRRLAAPAPQPTPRAAPSSTTKPTPSPRPTTSSTPTKPAPAPTPKPTSLAENERLASLSARCKALVKERDAALQQVELVRRELEEARKIALEQRRGHAQALMRLQQAAPAPVVAWADLAAHLRERGLAAGEEAEALSLIARGDALGSLLGLLEARDPDALAALLRRRLALVCGDRACAPAVGAAALRVARARCEVCGGSDILRAASLFASACLGAGISRVRFVGGSPSYRSKLEELFPRSKGGRDSSLIVRVTAGDQRVRQSRSRSQQRGDDLTIIWGGTELDHATSGAYRPEHGRVEVIAHRGISRMLELAAAKIAG